MGPYGPTAVLPGIAFPGVVPEFTGARERPELPDLFAGSGVVGAKLAADSSLSAAHTDVNESVVVDDRRARRAARGIGKLGLPQERARFLVERDQRVVATS